MDLKRDKNGYDRRNTMGNTRTATPEHRHFACRVYGFQEMINGKYKLRIIWARQDGPRRYAEIKKGLLRDIDGSQEIAPRLLSRELKTLAAFGLIKRTEYQVVPPKVEYSLTSLGLSLLPILTPMVEWGRQHLSGDSALEPNAS